MNDHQHLPILRILTQVQKNVVIYYPIFAHALGNEVGAALFVSNFYFWEDKQEDKDERWIYKTQDAIQLETGMSRSMQETARKKLRSLDILEETKKGVPARLYYRFDWEKLNVLLSDHFQTLEKEKSGTIGAAAQKLPAIVHAMAAVYDTFYFDQTGNDFAWGTKAERGKHFGALKRIHDLFQESIVSKKVRKAAQEAGGDAPLDYSATANYEEIMNSWDILLERLPTWYREKGQFTPTDLYGSYNKIIAEITAHAAKPQKDATRQRASIADTL